MDLGYIRLCLHLLHPHHLHRVCTSATPQLLQHRFSAPRRNQTHLILLAASTPLEWTPGYALLCDSTQEWLHIPGSVDRATCTIMATLGSCSINIVLAPARDDHVAITTDAHHLLFVAKSVELISGICFVATLSEEAGLSGKYEHKSPAPLYDL